LSAIGIVAQVRPLNESYVDLLPRGRTSAPAKRIPRESRDEPRREQFMSIV